MPWLRRTGQTWKLVVFMVGMVVPWGLHVLAAERFDEAWVLGLAVFVWFMLALRCPRCGGRPAWRLANSVRAGDFGTALVSAQRCPICRDGEEGPLGPPPLFSAYCGM